MSTPRVKICGLRQFRHAEIAVKSGAELLGFVFVEGVRRQILPDKAGRITSGLRTEALKHLSHMPQNVGLFHNQPLGWVRDVINHANLDIVQLTGNENLQYAQSLDIPIIRQIPVKPNTKRQDLLRIAEPWLNAEHWVVLDRYDSTNPGGTGKVFDWSVAGDIASFEGVLLAGGLNPKNVAAAIDQLKPWGVDVSTGVETDGEKDPKKITAFIAAVHRSKIKD